MKELSRAGTILLASFIVFAGAGCDPVEFLNADVERGGALYDKWWVVAEVDEPTGDHPLWATRPDLVSNSRTGVDTWRCKECHGWDYKGVDGAYASGSHKTGFAGIFGLLSSSLRSKAAVDVFDTLKVGHSLGTMTDLTDADIWDLAKFALEGQIDTDDIIDGSRDFIGDVVNGEILYAANCASCHGADGLTEVTPGFEHGPGFLANDNAEEFQHKVSFGHPGAVGMPALATDLSVEELGDICAYSQSLPTEPLPEGFENASRARGGALYDKWWVIAAVDAATSDHPLWSTRPDMSSNTRKGSDTWRCKECHGWDYKGVDGVYGSGSHRTGFAGIFEVADGTLRAKSAQDVFDTIKTDHDFGTLTDLDDGDIWDLAKFVLEGQLDTDDIIDGSRDFIGELANGQTLYEANCFACHGADGLTEITPDFDHGPGFLSNDNAEEFQHKLSFGHPGALGMPPLIETTSVADLGDLGAYSQTLPIPTR